MGIIGTILVGFIVGLIARALMPGKQGMGFVMTTILGIVGSVVAGYLGQMLGLYAEAGSAPGWVASVLGAMLVLFVVGMLGKKK